MPSIASCCTLKESRLKKIITFGQHQGDYAAVVTKEGKIGFVVIGYGSCSACDAYFAASSCDNKEDKKRLLTDLTYSVINSIFWSTPKEVADKIRNLGQDNNWYRHEETFKAKVNTLSKVALSALPSLATFTSTKEQS